MYRTITSTWDLSYVQCCGMSSTGQYQSIGINSRYLFVSSDYGNTWVARQNDASRSWTGISLSSTGQYQTAVAGNSFIYTSSNYGNTWASKSVGLDYSQFPSTWTLNGTLAASRNATSYSGQYVLMGGWTNRLNNQRRSGVYYSTNYGVSFAYSGDDSNDNIIIAIAISGSGEYSMFISSTGRVYRSINSYNHSSYTTLPSLSVGPPTMCAMSYSGQYRLFANRISTDYGGSYSVLPGGLYFECVAMSYTGQYMVGASGPSGVGVYSSNNYGSSWSFIGNAASWSWVAMSSSGQYITLVGLAGIGIYISTNYGISLSFVGNTAYGFVTVSMSASDGKYQVATFSSSPPTAPFLVSTNFGQTWTLSQSTLPNSANSTSVPGTYFAMSSTGEYMYASQITGSGSFPGVSYRSVLLPGPQPWTSVSISSTGQYQVAATSSDYV